MTAKRAKPLTSRDRVRQPAPKCGKSLTEQHHEKSCNVNSIMAKYQKTGLIDHVSRHQPKYGDVSGADYKAAQDLVAEQKSAFHELPSSVRAEFGNDPAEYLNLVMTDEGVQELQNILNPPQEDPEEENDPPKPDSDGSKDGEADESAVT